VCCGTLHLKDRYSVADIKHVSYLRSAAYISCSDAGVLRVVGPSN